MNSRVVRNDGGSDRRLRRIVAQIRSMCRLRSGSTWSSSATSRTRRAIRSVAARVATTEGYAPNDQPVVLCDLARDPGQKQNVAAAHPDIVAELLAHVERARADLGDAVTETIGADLRPVGEVDDPVPLTVWNPDHPYYIAEYDLGDRG